MSRVQEQIHAVEHRSTLVGFDFFGFRDKLQTEVKAPRTRAQILELLPIEGEKYTRILEGASDDFLGEQVECIRQATAEWFTHNGNGRFARTVVNRYWKNCW